MSKEGFTLILVPEKSDGVKTWGLSRWVFFTLVGIVVSTALVFSILFFEYSRVINQIRVYSHLRSENQHLRRQISEFVETMKTLDREVAFYDRVGGRFKFISNNFDEEYLTESTLHSVQAPTNETLNAPPQGTGVLDFSFNLIQPSKWESQIDIQTFGRLHEALTTLKEKALAAEEDFEGFFELFQDQEKFMTAMPNQRPSTGIIKSGFGWRRSFDGRMRMHEGIDIADSIGTAIHATSYGVVKSVNVKRGYGKTIVINHGFGITTWYSHLNTVIVKTGTRVMRGQKIGELGQTGITTGKHLHYEIRIHEIPVDPVNYIFEDWRNRSNLSLVNGELRR